MKKNKIFFLMMTILNCFLCCLFMLPSIDVVNGNPEVLEYLSQHGSDSYLMFYGCGAFAMTFFDMAWNNFARYFAIRNKEKEQN